MGWAALLIFSCVILASSPARADTVFDINANITNGPYTGTDVITGTITINTATGQGDAIDLSVSTDPSAGAFTGILGVTCSSPNCAFFYNSGFSHYGDMILGDTVGYTGGSLGSGSWIYLGSDLYYITGEVTPAVANTPAPTPEPNPLILVLSGMAGLSIFLYRRRMLRGL